MKLENLEKLSSVFYLEIIKSFVDELKESNSGNYKKEVLNKWLKSKLFTKLNFLGVNDLQNLLHYVYDYDKQYYITSDNIIKHENDEVDYFNKYSEKEIYTLWDLLDDLRTRKYTGYEAIYRCISFIKKNDEIYKDLILSIINKDLEIGVSEKTINKIIPGFIKTFDVCLANKYDDKKHKLDDNWLIERKLDGIRCILIYKNENDIKCYSRKGKEFTTLQKIINEVKGKLSNNTVLDGELCIIDKEGNEDFQGIMKVIKRKDYIIENPMYKVFDCLQMKDFEDGTSQEIYSQRVNRLNYILSNNDFKTISPVNYERYSEEAFERWKQYVIDNNWEGLMFRKDTYYEGKRTSDLLKYKTFNDAEYKVIGIEKGIVQDVVNGVVQKIEAVGSLIIEHKGNKVGVGSGLSLEQRKRWLKYPEEIIGKQICVKFFEETIDQDGKPSLRFPVLKYIYDNERDV